MISLIAALTLSMSAIEQHGEHGQHGDHHPTNEQASSTVAADVRAVDAEGRTAVVRHDALTELGMGGMTMRFTVDDAVDFSLFQPAAALTITVVNGSDGFEIIAAELRAE
jgi:Cu/Ag efflux protein CusF